MKACVASPAGLLLPTPCLLSEFALSQSNPCEVETIRIIDQRQTQVLEDLERLNQRILDIIELHTANRQPEDEQPLESDPVTSPDSAAPAA